MFIIYDKFIKAEFRFKFKKMLINIKRIIIIKNKYFKIKQINIFIYKFIKIENKIYFLNIYHLDLNLKNVK